MLDTLLPVLLFTALAFAVLSVAKRFLMWHHDRPAKVDRIGGLLQMPRRYLVDLHYVVERDRCMSRAHVATAGGFVLTALLATLVHDFGLYGRILGFVLLTTTALMFAGALFVVRCRLDPPLRLSKDPWMRLSKSLPTFAVNFFLTTLPVAGILPEGFGGWFLAGLLAIGVAWGMSELFLGMTWGGPTKHAFAGALHLAQHRRAERFDGGRSTGLKALGLADPYASLGVEKPSDFTWNRLLGFDTCVQCSKCEAICPAFAADQPLNPKKLIQDMVIDLAGGNDARFAGNPYPGEPLGEHGGGPYQPIVALDGKALVDADTLWPCTTCQTCVEECPMIIEHVDAIVDMRHHLTPEKGATSNRGAEVLNNLITTDNLGGFALGGRLNWAADLNLPLMSEKKNADVLFRIGDGTFDMRNQRTLRAFVRIFKAAAVDFAVLGLGERDSGDVARRLGDEAAFQNLARRNITTLARYRLIRVVSCDPYSFHALKNEYGALGGDYQVLHHSAFADELLHAGTLQPGRSKAGSVTYHNPCYLGHYNGGYEVPRNVLRALGIEVKEMRRSGFRSRCCGGGGGAPITDIPGKQRIPDMRMADICETSAELATVGCPQRTAMFEGVVAPRPGIKDIAELVAEALIEQAEAPVKKPVWREAVTEVHW